MECRKTPGLRGELILEKAGTVVMRNTLPMRKRVATMFVTCLSLVYARKIHSWIGPKGVDAATRIVGFFVASMGMGLVFHGVVQALQQYGIVHMQ